MASSLAFGAFVTVFIRRRKGDSLVRAIIGIEDGMSA